MNERLSLQDLIDLLARKQEITKKDAEVFLRELISIISENIENNEPVKIKDFGVFKLVKVNVRKSVDVNTGEAIEIPAHYKLSFVPDKSLKDIINRPFAHFESVVLEDGVSFENIESGDDTDDAEDVAIVEEELPIEQESTIENIVEEESIPEEADIVDDSVINTITEAEAEEDVAAATEEDIQQEEAIDEESVEEPEEGNEINEISEEESDDKNEESFEETLENEDVVLIDDEVVEVEDSSEEPIQTEESENSIDVYEDDETEEPEFEEAPAIAEEDADIDEQDSYERSLPDTAAYIKPEPDIFERRKEKQRKRKFITLGFFIFLILAGFIIGALYFQEIARYITEGPEDKGKKTVIVFEKEDPNDSIVTPSDTIILDEDNPAPSIEEVVDQKPKQVEPQAQTQQPAATATPSSAETTVKTGDTLRNIAMAYYGHKSFWVYIYQENKNVIPNFNNVPIGTKLAIPPRSKYGIDATNPASVEKAKKMEAELFSKM